MVCRNTDTGTFNRQTTWSDNIPVWCGMYHTMVWHLPTAKIYYKMSISKKGSSKIPRSESVAKFYFKQHESSNACACRKCNKKLKNGGYTNTFEITRWRGFQRKV